MIRIKIVAVGRVKEKYYNDAIAEYTKRLGRYAKVELIELDEITTDNELEKEALVLMPKLSGYVVAMDKFGEKLSSEQISIKLAKEMQCNSEITFVIGSSVGLADSVKKRANYVLSFGNITLPHSLARVLLCEQLYRAFSILNGGKYHK